MSQYLQTSGLDLQKAHKMVMQSIEQLQCISRDFTDIKEKVEKFVKWANDKLEPENLDFVEEAFPIKRRK